MGEYKTPGVYIKERNAFGNSVVEAETAIPAFIGYTEKAVNGQNVPTRITSMTEYVNYFGGKPSPSFTVSVSKEEQAGQLCVGANQKFLIATAPENIYTLYYNMVMFFANGGGTCYIVSIGAYSDKGNIDRNKVVGALSELKKIQEVTMVVVPEAVLSKECKDIQQEMLKHCGDTMKNRFAILDMPKGEGQLKDSVENYQTNIGANYLNYGAAYYPWLETSVLSDSDITDSVMKWDSVGTDLDGIVDKTGLKENEVHPLIDFVKIASPIDRHNALLQNLPAYKQLVQGVKRYLNCLPPSAAMAGIYSMVDRNRGVWKAPANVTLSYVNNPSENITDEEQGLFNAPMNGKAINAIRSFRGEGVKVWGARTLDGNSNDWRYINVRRTMMFLEQSVKNAARAYVFEPNDANTWINMRCMIENFLRSVWKRGGLAGSTPEEAYEVHVGLGDTMTSDDILEGIMRITVLVAITHPAEFIEITFQQQAQKS